MSGDEHHPRRSRSPLERSEERFRLSQAVARIGNWEVDLATRSVWASDEAFRIYGVTPTPDRTVPLSVVQDRPLPEHRAELDRALRELVATGAPYDVRFRIRRADDGAVRLVHSMAQVVCDDAGRPWLIAGTVQDITEREERHQRMVDALAASEERARLAFERAADAILLFDADATITQGNDKAVLLTGRPLEDLVGRNLSTLFSEEQLRTKPFRVDEVRAGETVVTQRLLLRADGVEVPVEMSSRRLGDGLAQAIVRDLTERRRLEEQLLQARKLEAVGRLAAGVAHDFNNLLVVILSGCRFLLERPLSAEQREEVEQILGAGQRAANLVAQLLTFSRKGRSDPIRTDLNAAVGRIEKLLRRTIGEDVALQVVQVADPWPIEADPTQLDQVLMNLAVNARDAMPDGGWLRIETRNEVLPDERDGAAGGRFASLVVSDGGTGISPEVQKRIFEPFFTTKPGGEGTGLGLSTIFGIVHQAGGRIDVESEPGHGATFRLSFPVAPGAGAGGQPEPVRDEEAAAGETVLVVEDDDGVRRSVVRMLEELGFRVLQAAGGPEALERARAGRVDVALVDVVMPGMLGTELAERLRAVQPGVVVAFQSGYADQKTQRVPAGAPFIEKPFTADALRRFLLGVLRG